MFERFKILPQLVATGRLALRLLRDSRTPMAAKLILGATALYLASPIDVMPDWFPLVGQADDLLAVLAGLNLFIRACPRWLVEEHEQRLGRKSSPPRADGPIIEGRYRRVD
jgi:uncharacterized membrane protein YkvA (DUF1232 family)